MQHNKIKVWLENAVINVIQSRQDYQRSQWTAGRGCTKGDVEACIGGKRKATFGSPCVQLTADTRACSAVANFLAA